MEEQMEKSIENHRVDAGRGVPLEKQPLDQTKAEDQVKAEESERLDEKIRKAGI